MRLGATISSYFENSDPDSYVAECRKWGYRSAPCPSLGIKEGETIRAIAEAFSAADIVIGEFCRPREPTIHIPSSCVPSRGLSKTDCPGRFQMGSRPRTSV
jgi:hypothetical protein